MLFADDLAYIVTYKNKNEAENKAQKYLDEIETWTNKWRLTLAPHKCSQIIFTRSKKSRNLRLNLKQSRNSK